MNTFARLLVSAVVSVTLPVGCTLQSADAPEEAIGQQADEITIPLTPINPSLYGPKQVAMSHDHGCVLYKVSGRMKCWGSNVSGQLGDSTQVDHTTPVLATAITDPVLQVAATQESTCGIFGDGMVRCWGVIYPADGDVDRVYTPVPVAGLPVGQYVQVVGGNRHFCARDSVGKVFCWGYNGSGQVSATAGSGYKAAHYVISGASDVSTGSDHACAVVSGTVSCWGWNADYRLGVATTSPSILPPTTIPGLGWVKRVAAGGAHTCALRNDGTVLCWGSSRYCQAGGKHINDECEDVTWSNGGLAPKFNYIPLAGVQEIIAGSTHSCARINGAVYCWGMYGLGPDTAYLGRDPRSLSNLSSAVSISTGVESSCAIQSGNVLCWGWGPLTEYQNKPEAVQDHVPELLPL